MLPKRVMDLPNWGSGPAGAFKPGDTFAVSLQNVTIDRVIPGQKGYVTIAGRYGERTVFCNIGPLDEKTLPKVAKIVDEHRGQPLLSIGTVEIPSDEE